MLNKFNSIILRDMRVILNSNSRIFMPVVYLFLIITFFSISLEGTVLGGYDKILTQIIWLSCLLVSLLNIEIMFKDDYEDGTLDRIVINSDMLEICILAKVLSHWLFSILPLVIIAFLINFLLTGNLSVSISLMIGSLTISLIGSIASSLTLSLKGNGLLLSTIVLPLDIPVLIFGTSAIYNSSIGLNYDSELLFMLLLLILFLVIAPFAASFGVKNSLD
jgi:heme exporter protein B